MDLLHTARALDDKNFRWRVAAAMVEESQGFQNMSGNPRNFAISTLMHPQQTEISMVALVAADDAVAAAIKVENDTVDTNSVLDEDIIRVVKAKWNLVAAKYTKDPLAAPTTAP